MKWKVTFAMKEIGCFDTFKDAFVALYCAIKKESSLTYQLLETATWIISDVPQAVPIYFYDARDMAYNMGILKDGKLVD